MSSQSPAVLQKHLFKKSSIDGIQSEKASKLGEITWYHLEPMLTIIKYTTYPKVQNIDKRAI